MFSWKVLFCSTLFVLLSIVVVQCEHKTEKYLVFRLYTREHPHHHQALNIDDLHSASSFNPNRPTRIFVHGFLSNEKVFLRYKDAYLHLGNNNFIAVDWTKGAATYNYFKAKKRVKNISVKLGRLLTALVIKRDLNLQEVTIVGHSLGAHIAGRAGKYVQQLSRPIGRIACIIGLDPASFGFHYLKPVKRLTAGDADYVQVIHTDGDKFGLPNPIGDADFYPNGGREQPGCPVKNRIACWMDECSHSRAHQLFLESLAINFTAIRCDTPNAVQDGYCVFDKSVGRMGGDITANSPKPYGIFYLETKNDSLFFIPDYHDYKKSVTLDIGTDNSDSESDDDDFDYLECFTSF